MAIKRIKLTFLAIWISAPIWHRSHMSGFFSSITSFIFCNIIAWLSSIPFNWFRDKSNCCSIEPRHFTNIGQHSTFCIVMRVVFIWDIQKKKWKKKNKKKFGMEKNNLFSLLWFISLHSLFYVCFLWRCAFTQIKSLLTSRLLTGCNICMEILTKWFPDKFNAFNCPSGTNNSYGMTPISAIDKAFIWFSNCHFFIVRIKYADFLKAMREKNNENT